MIHMILLLKLAGWLEYQPGRRDRQTGTHAKGMGFFYFMRFCMLLCNGPCRQSGELHSGEKRNITTGIVPFFRCFLRNKNP